MATESKYQLIYDKMQDGVYYSASELGVAAASMTAMYNRGMVERTETSPRKYKKIKNKYSEIDRILTENAQEGYSDYFTSFVDLNSIGMLCSIDRAKSRVLDKNGDNYDVSKIVAIRFAGKVYPLD